MARNCRRYKDNTGPCDTVGNSSGAFDDGPCTDSNRTSNATKQTATAKLISDPTGNKKGNGIDNRYDSKCFCQSLQTPISFTMRGPNGDKTQQLMVNKNLADEIKAIMKEIHDNTGFIIEAINCFDYRTTHGSANDGKYLSYHSYGVAIDLNGGDYGHNPYKQGFYNRCSKCGKQIDGNSTTDKYHLRNPNHEVVKIFNKYGWYWGGKWHKPDYMHFCKFNG